MIMKEDEQYIYSGMYLKHEGNRRISLVKRTKKIKDDNGECNISYRITTKILKDRKTRAIETQTIYLKEQTFIALIGLFVRINDLQRIEAWIHHQDDKFQLRGYANEGE